jgi:hypothetical protein
MTISIPQRRARAKGKKSGGEGVLNTPPPPMYSVLYVGESLRTTVWFAITITYNYIYVNKILEIRYSVAS